MINRGFRDKDFIETIEGLIFCIIGNVHPPDKVLSYLKYIPEYESKIRIKWTKTGKHYGRILPYYSAMGFNEVLNYLKKHYPEYVCYDRYWNIETIMIPKNKIKFHFKPEVRLQELISNPIDELEELALELVNIISNESNVPLNYIGISGSILLKMHNIKFSDIDLTVYGRINALKVKETIINLLNNEEYGFSRPKGDILTSWARDIIKIHPLSLSEALIHYGEERWSRALFKNRQFSIRAVKLENEVEEKYGSKIYEPKGLIKIKCRVKDASDAIFLPCKYIVENCNVIEGPKVDVIEVVSYEGLYSDIASENEEIIVYGKLEKVIDLNTNEKHYRVCVGSVDAKGKDYIKPIRWFRRQI